MALNDGERQVAPTTEGIRRDHVARYQWAASRLRPGMTVLDVACGVGYGAHILAEAGCRVTAVDRDAEAIAYAREHYAHDNITYLLLDAGDEMALKPHDAAVSFETIEHLAEPERLLGSLRAAPLLFASVPNEERFPYGAGYKFHHRHYTRREFAQLLAGVGYEVESWHGQAGPQSEVELGVNGRTTVVRARQCFGEAKINLPDDVAAAAPEHVAILGLGPTVHQFTDYVMRMGGRSAFCSEVWTINALGNVLDCDRVFHMDQVEIQELRAAAAPHSNIAKMLEWLKTHPGPIYTSIPKPGYPGLVALPIEDMINALGFAYFNNTAAYAVAYAIYIGVRKISLFGLDFTRPNAHHAEQGRACVEFWLGIAAGRGIELGFAEKTTLMDTLDDPADPEEIKLYGFDTVKVLCKRVDGTAKLSFVEREVKPTAAEIEDRYDHTQHPNSLVKSEARAFAQT